MTIIHPWNYYEFEICSGSEEFKDHNHKHLEFNGVWYWQQTLKVDFV